MFARMEFRRFKDRWIRHVRHLLFVGELRAQEKTLRREQYTARVIANAREKAARKARYAKRLADAAVKRAEREQARQLWHETHGAELREKIAVCVPANEAAREFDGLKEVTREPPDYAVHVPIQNLLDLMPVDPLWDGMLPTPDGWGNIPRWRRQLHSSYNRRRPNESVPGISSRAVHVRDDV